MLNRQFMACLVGASVVLATGCGSDGSGPPGSTPQPGTPSLTPSLGPHDAAARDAVAAYRGMWDAFVEAGRISDPDAPGVRRYATEQALSLIVSSLHTNREQGKVIKGELALSPKVTEVKPIQAPTEATVLDCVDSTNWLEYKVSGGLWDDEPGGRHRTTATVKVFDGTWKVSSFVLEESGTC